MWLAAIVRFWRELLRDVLLTGAGLAVIGSQVIAQQPNAYLIGAGLSLTFPSTFVKIREIFLTDPPGTDGGRGVPSEPPGSSHSPKASGAHSEGAGK